jgi:diadenosine tetraphosphate (Ap4A) HIT family hydrolase
VDEQTWTEMGELFRESVKRIERILDPSSLRTCIFLGQIGGWQQEENSGLQIHLIPRYKSQGHEAKEVIPVPPEVLEVAERLREAENKLEKEKVKQLESKIEVPFKN